MTPRSVLVSLVAALAFAAASAQDSAPTSKPTNDAETIARRIEERVAKLRGLAFKSPTKIGVYTKEELKSFLLKEAEKELAPEATEPIRRAYTLFGLMPEAFDLRASLLKVLESQIAGFYDPEKKELFLIKIAAGSGDAARTVDESIMSHELVHALQDQYFDLKTAMDRLKKNNDRLNAYKSLVEGDAMYAMMVFSMAGKTDDLEAAMKAVNMSAAMMPTTLKDLRPLFERAKAQMGKDGGLDLGSMDAETLLAAPAVIGDEMVFAYLGGMKFCAYALQNGAEKGMQAVDQAFRKPPESTEQILHPEKYSKVPDGPTEVALPDLSKVLGTGWKELASDTLGELHVRTLLNDNGVKRPGRIHAGWDGDRYAVYAKDGAADVLAWYSVWDTKKDAGEFAEAQKEIFALRLATHETTAGESLTLYVGLNGTSSFVALVDNRVLVVKNAPSDKARALFDKLRSDTALSGDVPSATAEEETEK